MVDIAAPSHLRILKLIFRRFLKKAYYRFEILTIATPLISSHILVRARGGKPIGYFLTHFLPGYIELVFIYSRILELVVEVVVGDYEGTQGQSESR